MRCERKMRRASRRNASMFQFDLQLFGGGGNSGKSTGKIIGSIVAGVLSAGAMGGAGLFSSMGVTGWTANFMFGASLFSSIWSAFSKPNNSYNSYANVQRFDRSQEAMSSNGALPLIYGERKISGNQTYHKTNSDASELFKHVVLCEGGIEGVSGLAANELLIPTGSQTSSTVFTLRNIKYTDATASISGRYLYLNCGGGSHTIYLCVTSDMTVDTTYWDYQVNVSALISYINRLGEGWQAFPVASTSLYPGNLSTPGGNCYNNPINFTASTVRGGTSYTLKDGVRPDNYEECGAYPDMAWLDMKLVISDELNGNPSISCLVKGKKVYDARTGETKYSTNPAWCLRDFLLSKRYGLGKWFSEEDLDDDSFIEAANYCDEVIEFYAGDGSTTKAKRYELNMVIDERRSALDWLQEMLACFAGYLVYSQGKLRLKIEKPTPISYRFNDDTMKDLKIEPLKLSETPNRYEVSFVDPLNNWRTIMAICEDHADQKERQKIITKQVGLEGVTSQNQALRLARFYRDYNLTCPLQVSFTTGMQAMHLEPGDVVTISYHGVFDGMPIRIAEIKETNKGTFEISGRQYNDTIYTDELGGGIQWYQYSTMDTPYVGEVPNVLNLKLKEDGYISQSGTYIGHVDVTWDPPAYDFVSSYDIYYSYDGKEYQYVGNAKDTMYTIQNTRPFEIITVKVVTVNTMDRRSIGSTASLALEGKNSPPGDITKFVIGQYSSDNEFVLEGKVPDDIDFDHVELRMDGDTWEDAKKICDFYSFPYRVRNVSIPWEGNHVFRVKAVDTAGIESEHDAIYQIYVRDPSRFKNVILEYDSIELGNYTMQGFVDTDDGTIVNPWGIRFDDRWDATFDDFIDTFDSEYMDSIVITSDVIDIRRNRLTNINYIFEEEVIELGTTFDDIWDKTFDDVWINTFENMTHNWEREIYIRYSEDNENWTEWKRYVSASYQFRYIQYKVVYNLATINTRVNVKRLYQSYDVPDIEITFRDTTVNGTKTIVFDDEFMYAPTQVSCVITGSLYAFPIVEIDTQSATVRTYDVEGNPMDVSFMLTVKGW